MQSVMGRKSAQSPCKILTGVFNAMRTIFPSSRLKFFTFRAVNVFALCLHVLIEGQFMQADEKTEANKTF